jgi:hypothetical protein
MCDWKCSFATSGQELVVVSLGKRHVDYLLNRSGGEVAAIARRMESLVDTRSVFLSYLCESGQLIQ